MHCHSLLSEFCGFFRRPPVHLETLLPLAQLQSSGLQRDYSKRLAFQAGRREFLPQQYVLET